MKIHSLITSKIKALFDNNSDRGQPDLFLTLDGVPSPNLPRNGKLFYFKNHDGRWSQSTHPYHLDIDNICAHIHDLLAAKIFGSFEEYSLHAQYFPEPLWTGGLNSEFNGTKDQFGQIINILTSKNIPVNQALYLYDCRKLVASIQECSKEIHEIQVEFYKTLNLEENGTPSYTEPDGIRYVSSPEVTKLIALLSFIFIRLHSLLDYSTKLAVEIGNLIDDFSTYPRLASRNIQYGDRSKVCMNGMQGTLFEKCPEIIEIETIRNLLIHDGFLDDLPKVYRVILNGICVEKYILFPDKNEDGRLEALKNRNLFYGKEDKINQRLPTLISNFQIRLIETIKIMKSKLEL